MDTNTAALLRKLSHDIAGIREAAERIAESLEKR